VGIADKFLNFGTTKRGLIISWGLIVVSTIIFFSGVGMTVAATNAERVTDLQLTAANMQIKTGYEVSNEYGNHDGYHLTMTKPSWVIMTSVFPAAASAPVTFTTTSPLLEIETRTVPANGEGILKLKKQPPDAEFPFWHYVFSKPGFYEEVRVRSGGIEQIIYVLVVLRREDVTVTATLQASLPGANGKPGNNWIPVATVSMKYFDTQDVDHEFWGNVFFRVHLTLKIWKTEVIYDTSVRKEDFDRFKITELYVKTIGSGEDPRPSLDDNKLSRILNITGDEDDRAFKQSQGETIDFTDYYISIPRNAYIEDDLEIVYHVSVKFDDVEYLTATDLVVNIGR
jgi:hypothetical protein